VRAAVYLPELGIIFGESGFIKKGVPLRAMHYLFWIIWKRAAACASLFISSSFPPVSK